MIMRLRRIMRVQIIQAVLFFILLALTSPVLAQSLSDINLDWLERQEKYRQWGRDPFVVSSISPGEESGMVGGLNLSAIIYRKNSGTAIINNRILRKGDRINGKEISKILEDRVILRDGSGDRDLRVNKFSVGR
jgi:hypothetical protein